MHKHELCDDMWKDFWLSPKGARFVNSYKLSEHAGLRRSAFLIQSV